MRGVVFVGERELEIREFPDPTPGPGEVIVQIKASGVCGSDLHSYREPKSVRTPARQCIAGHEPCGVVAARGPGVREEAAPIEDAIRCSACRSNSKSAGAPGSSGVWWPAAKASNA